MGIIDIKDEQVFVVMIEKRNQIIHICDFDAAKLIYGFVKDAKVFSAIKRVCEKLSKAKKDNV